MSVENIITSLKEHLTLLSDDEQSFVLHCEMLVSVAFAPVTADQVRRLQAIQHKLGHITHNTLDGDAPLSFRRVIQNLASALHMLTPSEQAFAKAMARKINQGEALSHQEMERLLNIHAAKGF